METDRAEHTHQPFRTTNVNVLLPGCDTVGTFCLGTKHNSDFEIKSTHKRFKYSTQQEEQQLKMTHINVQN